MKPEFRETETISRLRQEGRFLLGKHSYGNPEVLWWGEDVRLSIGSFCSIADGVTIILGGNHRDDWITTYPFSEFEDWPKAHAIPGHPSSKGDIQIGSDVWIGNGATILSGITIGDGAIVGARSVVAKTIPPYSIAVGNPARIIRYRFKPEIIDNLMEIAWWKWSEEEISTATPYLLSPDIKDFLLYCQYKRKPTKHENTAHTKGAHAAKYYFLKLIFRNLR